MKFLPALATFLVIAPALAADERAAASQGLPADGTQNPLPRHFPTKDRFVKELAGPSGGGGNLSYRGGPVIQSAYVVPIYWGSVWGTATSPSALAADLNSYISTFGTSGEYNTITQYYQLSGTTKQFIKTASLTSTPGTPVFYESTAPATNVTDAAVQAEILGLVGANNLRGDTVYEVFLPKTSYSSNGTSTSCGGPKLAYCAYHGSFTTNGVNVKYAVMPYPSCGGCQTSNFSDAQNFEHFIAHETREAVTDPNGNAWFDNRGYEADDKCAWSPTPFTDSTAGSNTSSGGGAFAYQYEWSNAVSGCVKTVP